MSRGLSLDEPHEVILPGAHRPGDAQWQVGRGAVAGARTAMAHINLTGHKGAHPRMGATDVIPFIPLQGSTMADAVAAAEEAAERIAKELSIPTYLYGEAARRAAPRT